MLSGGALLLLSGCTSAGFSLLNVPAAVKGRYSVHEASYGAGRLDTLDLYIPDEGSTGSRDVIVFLYGGRWQSGEKEEYRFVGSALAQRGFVTVIPDFRKYPAVRFPAFVEDGARALAWVQDHIAEYGGRPDRIYLAGHSSGAHVAALLTVDPHYLERQGKDVRALVKGFAGLAGPYAFTPTDADLMELFGPPSRYPQMQATTFVAGQEPPMLLLYGEQDRKVKPANHERLAERIRATGGHVEVITYPELGHVGLIGTFSGFGPASSVVDDMVAFFRAIK
ncbi:MAG: Esterase/lipase/thioesterase family protein [Nitrospira sp.]|jgi:acetyl esterase/lipase|nr:Esterase/lipase/thioesterase family protein [Nitrospira sp.]